MFFRKIWTKISSSDVFLFPFVIKKLFLSRFEHIQSDFFQILEIPENLNRCFQKTRYKNANCGPRGSVRILKDRIHICLRFLPSKSREEKYFPRGTQNKAKKQFFAHLSAG
jgi:hypothetical protein